MYILEVCVFLSFVNLLSCVICAPFVFDDDDSDLELRTKNRNRKPCSRNGEAKTFFPVHFSYVNVNYNYNCDGGNQQQHNSAYSQSNVLGMNKPGHHKPFGHKPHHHRPGGNKPSKPQTTTKPTDTQYDPVDDYPLNQALQKPTNKPFHTFIHNHSQGTGIFNSIWNGIFGGTTTTIPSATTVIPVHEVQEDVTSPKYKPGQYTAAYNPVTGQYAQDMSQFNSKQLYKTLNQGADRFLRSLFYFF
ncbi:hypothetical protein QE152_g30760 [Popillia japonica]|uniref:Uncharacterized protein n=1 Tax=Popillia japonica TaxID=7064 RepID=A0AAW1JDR1_POPJA